MGNLANLVKALLGSMFDVWSFEAKNKVFDYQKMNMFEFIQCSKMMFKTVFDQSLQIHKFVQ